MNGVKFVTCYIYFLSFFFSFLINHSRRLLSSSFAPYMCIVHTYILFPPSPLYTAIKFSISFALYLKNLSTFFFFLFISHFYQLAHTYYYCVYITRSGGKFVYIYSSFLLMVMMMKRSLTSLKRRKKKNFKNEMENLKKFFLVFIFIHTPAVMRLAYPHIFL